MLRRILLFFVVFSYCCSVWAQTSSQKPNREANLRELANAELEFAQTAQKEGINAAFAKFFADDSIAFTPNAVNGKQYYLSSKKDPGVLTWKPIYTDVSAAGDLGYNTGPYEYSEAPGKPPIIYGYFVSVWRREADGKWKVVLDLGTYNDAPAEISSPKFAQINNLTENIDAAKEQNRLVETDAKFAQNMLAKGADNDISKYIGENIRMNRMRAFPSTSREDLLTDLRAKQGKFTSQTSAVHIAKSGDLGYSYGTYQINNSASEAENEKGNFLRIWRLQKDGKWKLVVDVQRPLASKRKQTN